MKVDLRRLFQRLVRRLTRPKVPIPLDEPPPLARLPADYQAAAVSLVDQAAVQSAAFRARLIREPRDNVSPELLKFALALLKELERRGMPFIPFSWYRSRDEQNALFKNGVTKARGGQSAHNFGLAVDIVHFGKWWDLTPRQWEVVGHIGKQVAKRQNLKVTWGGDWQSFYDPAHWEIASWREQIAST